MTRAERKQPSGRKARKDGERKESTAERKAERVAPASPLSPADLSAPAESSAALIKPRKVGYYAQQQKGKGGPVKAPRARALTVEEVMLQQEAAIMLQGAVRRAATEFAFFVAKKRYQAAAVIARPQRESG